MLIMSDKSKEEIGSSGNATSQALHVYPSHRTIPPTSVASAGLAPFTDLSPHDANANSFVSRPSHHFPTSTYQ